MKRRSLNMVEYAAHRKAKGLSGATSESVRQAIARGRLRNSLTEDGKIRDAAAADAEWESTTNANRRPLTGPAGKMPELGGDKLGEKKSDLGESMARKAAADAGLAEIKLAQARGDVVLAASVQERLVSIFANCKTKLLGIPSRVRQQDPGQTPEQIALIESLVREALEDLSSEAEAKQ